MTFDSPYPALPLDEWRPTRDALRRYAQVMGKIREILAPPEKHWYHVNLRPAATGLITPPIFQNGISFEILLDLTIHSIDLKTSIGGRRSLSLDGQSQAEMGDQLLSALADSGIDAAVDLSDFRDSGPAKYDRPHASRFWQALSRVNGVFAQFRAGLREQTSPVNLWPHHFDLAVLWFSGRLVKGQDPANADYADEQMNFGFVTGDDTIPEAYFYATAYPLPAPLAKGPLPAGTHWHSEGFQGAVLPYAELNSDAGADALLLNFLQSMQRSGSACMPSASITVEP